VRGLIARRNIRRKLVGVKLLFGGGKASVVAVPNRQIDRYPDGRLSSPGKRGYAKEQLSSPLSVETLPNAAFLSPRQFSRLFREETGQSPARAFERLRVESARLMMEADRFSAEEIARKNGFGNRERMRRSFVRSFGQSP
jgi:AraC-like DNA-binding protein